MHSFLLNLTDKAYIPINTSRTIEDTVREVLPGVMRRTGKYPSPDPEFPE